MLYLLEIFLVSSFINCRLLSRCCCLSFIRCLASSRLRSIYSCSYCNFCSCYLSFSINSYLNFSSFSLIMSAFFFSRARFSAVIFFMKSFDYLSGTPFLKGGLLSFIWIKGVFYNLGDFSSIGMLFLYFKTAGTYTFSSTPAKS